MGLGAANRKGYKHQVTSCKEDALRLGACNLSLVVFAGTAPLSEPRVSRQAMPSVPLKR